MSYQNTVERLAVCGDDPLVIEWHIKRHIMFTWEIDVEALDKLVPEELTPVEVRPGIGLFSVAMLRYAGDNFFPGSPEFIELVSVAHVQSDLSIAMPMPRFSMHAISVYTDSPEFVKQEGELLFTPTQLDPTLELEWTETWDGCAAKDADGPIVSFKSTHPDPVFAHDEFWGQHYNDTNGLHRGIFEWDGMKCEHMQRGSAGRFHDHPFYKGMDLERIRGCYRQMIPQCGSGAIERFYRTHQLKRRGVR